MTTLSDRCFVSLLATIVLVAISTAAESPAGEEMELKVSLHYTVAAAGCYGYPPVCKWMVEITADVTWETPMYAVGDNYYDYAHSYWFYLDGDRMTSKWGDWEKAHVYILLQYLDSREECQNIALNYVNSMHTYRLDALPINDKWPVITDVFDHLPPDIMTIDNCVRGWSESRIGRCEVSRRQGATEEFDDMDVAASLTFPFTVAQIVSAAPPETGGAYCMAVDARPKDSTSDVYLQLSLISPSGDPILLPFPMKNELRFNIPTEQWSNHFGSQPILIQQYDSLAPDVKFPMSDVRKVIGRNGGVMPLADLHGKYPSGQVYAYLRMSFTTAYSLGDLNSDGRHDLRDFAMLGSQWRSKGAASFADMAGPKAVGLPDGVVDYFDVQALCQSSIGIIREGFEGGKIDSLPWVLAGFPFWKATRSACYSGTYAAQAGGISDDGSTSLWIPVTCHAGEIAFWRKVSSEAGCDWLEFYIDGKRQGRWSGEQDWERVSFPVSAGKRLFKWTYLKDSSSRAGNDTAWIDDIAFPALSLD